MIKTHIDSHFFVEKKHIPDYLLNNLKKEYTLINPVWEQAIKRQSPIVYRIDKYVSHYKEDESLIIFPRGRYKNILSKLRRYGFTLKDNRRKIKYPFKFKGKLKDYQSKACDEILKKDFGVLVAPPGCGKTIMSLYIITIRQQKTLIIVHTKELLNQWIERINTFLDIPIQEIGIIGNGREIIKPITIGMVQTLYKRDLQKIKKYFGQIIVDECHHQAANTFIKATSSFDSYYMLGLSATPYRRDRLNKLIYFHIGNIVSETNEEDLQKIGTRIKPEIVTKHTRFYYNFEDDYTRMINEMVEDPDRNKLIIKDILKESKNKDNVILILSSRKIHCSILSEMLKENRVENIILTAQTSEKERKEIIKNLNVQVIIAIGQLAGEGLDIPKLNRLFIVTPISWKGRVKQYIGRILRTYQGKKDAKIYDYVDSLVGVLKASYLNRYRNVYNGLI